MSAISIVIPVRNRQKITKKILEQLSVQINQINYEETIFVIVVDDGSTDGTQELIKNNFPSVHLIEGDGSLWWTGAIVKGMEYAIKNLNPDYFVWLNDDICLDVNFIFNLTYICNSYKYKETIVGGIVRNINYPDWIVYSGSEKGFKPISNINRFSSVEEIEVEVLCGNIVVIPRGITDQIGLPNAERLRHHGGDYEYIMRAKKAGFKAVLSSKLQANTDYQVTDFIRYMPYWLQWYLQPSISTRWEIIKGLTTLKANQNIWLIVNLHSSNRDSKHIPQWKYVLCYLNKIIRFLMIDFMPKKYVESRVYEYLTSQNPPQEIIDSVMQLRKLN